MLKITVIYTTERDCPVQASLQINEQGVIEDEIKSRLPHLKNIQFVFKGWPKRIPTNGG